MRQRARLVDVAQEAGVSLTTASIVVNKRDEAIPQETRERVWDAVRRLGYHPHAAARALATGRSSRLGVVFSEPESFGTEDTYCAEVFSGIIRKATARDRNLFLHSAHYRDWRALSSEILGGAADGAILVGRVAGDELTTALLDAEFPTVCVSYAVDHPRCVSVDCDNDQGAYQAARHLLCLGHDRLALLYPGEQHSWGAERHRGARRAVLQNGLREDALAAYAWPGPGPATDEWASGVVDAMLQSSPRPTGVVCCDEAHAVPVLDALRSAGLSVPEDCAVVSFNSTQISVRATPPMTSVWQPLRLIGEAAVDLLIDILDGKELPTSAYRFRMGLDVRASCGAVLPSLSGNR